MRKKETTRERVRRYRKHHPDASVVEMAKVFGRSRQAVYQAMRSEGMLVRKQNVIGAPAQDKVRVSITGCTPYRSWSFKSLTVYGKTLDEVFTRIVKTLSSGKK